MFALSSLRAVAVAGLLGLLAACTQNPLVAQAPTAAAAEPHSIASVPAKQAIATANPLATRAGLKMLAIGGAPIDAAIAAQMVLGLAEPQSSGLGGGTLILYWDEGSRRLTGYDGLAAAPRRVTAALTVDVDGSVLRSDDVGRGGRSVGIPGTLAVLAQVHQRFGKLPWATLFGPAIELAERGYPMQPYLQGVLSTPTAAAEHPDMLSLYFGPDGRVKPVGATIVNAPYAATLRRIASDGPSALWQGEAGAAIVAAAQRGFRPSLMTQADLAGYRTQPRDPLCSPFLAYSVCVMSPPSFGGIVVLQMLQMLQVRPHEGAGPPRFDFDDAEFVHYFAEAGRLAQADRLRYVGDPDFIAVPSRALVASAYARKRAAAIDPSRAARTVEPGAVDEQQALASAEALYEPADATSQLAIVDGSGNALSMTTTINLNFGSRLMVNGFVLNNVLTNFSGPPRAGQAAPNRMQPGKRPVTSMAPTIVFDGSGRPVIVGGSAGGGQIVDYISQSLVEMLGNGRTPAQALARGHVSTAIAGKLQLEAKTGAATLAPALSAKGHDTALVPLPSGLGFLMRSGDGWLGAADPRRDGVAQGQ